MVEEYRDRKDLPQDIQNLPEDAQTLYLATFNQAWEENRADPDSPDRQQAWDAAHREAWGAVNHEFSQDEDGHWYRDPLDEQIDKSQMPGTR